MMESTTGTPAGICCTASILLCPGLFELIELELHSMSCICCCGNLKEADPKCIYVLCMDPEMLLSFMTRCNQAKED